MKCGVTLTISYFICYVFFIPLLFLRFKCTHYIESRMVGGAPADIRNFPHQLCIVVKDKWSKPHTLFRGGGVIVSKYWALTAAHSVVTISKELITNGMVFMRGNSSLWNRGPYIDHMILKVEIHAAHYMYDYDIALIKVSTPFSAMFKKPVLVAGPSYECPENILVNVTGWDCILNDPFNVRSGEHLHYVNVTLIDHADCVRRYQGLGHVTEKMFCAYGKDRGPSICDAGSPVVWGRVLLGIVSWGMEYAPYFPRVYTNVSIFYTWLFWYEQRHNVKLGIDFVNSGN